MLAEGWYVDGHSSWKALHHDPTTAIQLRQWGGFAAWFGDVQDMFPNFRNIQHGKAFGEQMLFWRWSIFRRPKSPEITLRDGPETHPQRWSTQAQKWKVPISFSFSHSSWFFANFERGSRETTFVHIASYHAYHLPLAKIPSCRPTHWAFKVAAFKAMKHMIRLVKTCQLLSWSACLSWHLQKWVIEIMMDLMIVLQFFGFVFFSLAEVWKKKHLITRKRHMLFSRIPGFKHLPLGMSQAIPTTLCNFIIPNCLAIGNVKKYSHLNVPFWNSSMMRMNQSPRRWQFHELSHDHDGFSPSLGMNQHYQWEYDGYDWLKFDLSDPKA